MRKRIAAWDDNKRFFALTVAGCSQDILPDRQQTASNTQEEDRRRECTGGPRRYGRYSFFRYRKQPRKASLKAPMSLIAYFSVPEDVDTEGIDANAGASIVVRGRSGHGKSGVYGKCIQQTIGGDLFRIGRLWKNILWTMNHW